MAGKKILVADDSLTIQKVIRLALSGDGYEIQTVSDGKEALEQASLFRPDICIVDVSLPQHDAYQVREMFLSKPDLRHVPVILMSSAFEKVDEERARNLGFAGHLIKPFDPSHLRSTLLAVANQAPKNDDLISTTINAPLTPGPGPAADPSTSIRFDPPTPIDGHHDFPPMTSGTPVVDDIQEMAQNTFEMSGMNQHEWGMFEPGRTGTSYAPSGPPQPVSSYTPSAPIPSPNEVMSIDFNSGPSAYSTSTGYGEQTNHQFQITPQELEIMIKTEVAKVLDQMQSKIQDRIEHDLNQFAQAQLPSIAEKLIRDEIHKLLSSPPL
jgi:CheY-like chemotaxis protein